MYRIVSVIAVTAGFIGCSSKPPTPMEGAKVYVAVEDAGSVAGSDARSNRVLKDISLEKRSTG